MKWISAVLMMVAMPSMCLSLSPEEVTRSSMQSFPKVVEAILKVEEQKQKYRKLRGEFDAKIKGELDARTEGYYSGDAYKLQIEKPIPMLNARIYAGGRQSYGSFPVYEGKSVTLSDGELFAGVSLSLLRNSLIDIRRYDNRLAEQEVEISKAQRDQAKISVQTMALQSYWQWVIAGHRLKVHKSILALAESRAKQIKRRIRLGDLARIYESENNQYIMKRRAALKKSEAYFQVASSYLSLFYRTVQGQPIVVGIDDLPPIDTQNLSKAFTANTVFQKALSRSVEIRELEAKKVQAGLTRDLGQNFILPKVDLNLEWNQDQTVAAIPQNIDENRIMLKVEIPIEYRKGVGMRRAGEIETRRVETQLGFQKDKLKAESDQLTVKIKNWADVFTITRQEKDLAAKLAKAELRKFKQGASDLILVNIREENFGDAQVKNLQALLEYKLTEAELYRLSMTFL